jgi:hypothetical protein
MYSSFFISYTRPLHRTVSDAAGNFQAEYPLKFSFGLQAEQFPQFAGSPATPMVHPVIRLTIF